MQQFSDGSCRTAGSTDEAGARSAWMDGRLVKSGSERKVEARENQFLWVTHVFACESKKKLPGHNGDD